MPVVSSQRYVKKVTAKNEAFAELSKSEKRVHIAKDVIAALKTEYVHPMHGYYFSATTEKEGLLDHKACLLPNKMQDAFASIPSCRACALGALFLTSVLHHNKDSTRHVKGDLASIPGTTHLSTTIDDLVEELRRTFSMGQLWLIEAAFEDFSPGPGGAGGCLSGQKRRRKSDRLNLPYATKLADRARSWRMECINYYHRISYKRENYIPGPTYLVYSIMRNIIENGGEFNPSDRNFPNETNRKKLTY